MDVDHQLRHFVSGPSRPPQSVTLVLPRRSPGTAFQEFQPLQLPKGSVVSVPGPFAILHNMWNDEDNNPYGAFDQHESGLSDSLHSAALSPRKLSSTADCSIMLLTLDSYVRARFHTTFQPRLQPGSARLYLPPRGFE